MKKMLLSLALYAFTLCAFAQSGNTIEDAIVIDGAGVDLNVLDFNSATSSALTPACGTSADVFYKHDISNGDNKITIGMATLGLSLGSQIDFQILKAVNGDTNNLEEISCSFYDVIILVGGSFEVVIDDVNPNDDYYLRVYIPSGTLSFLTDLLNLTTMTMYSEFDATLSLNQENYTKFKMVVGKNSVQLINNKSYTSYQLYDLSGRLIASKNSIKTLKAINTSYLNNGVYIINFKGNGQTKSYKFIKS
ncbi:T9SS type A sorting domain-containing protein [Mangrovimonas spongiae]|uniref:T9SS C-terminal target domain-containing protein n=1 Tax=Mangrovimonas spongiae TaxID=2494697 RepID=A0A428JVI0_9FLAO|nr:T9SS type A sorting domain-containing protein [Mangrovimonas spongiae]RSK38217.1 T9SS C-terminal target domain-containing protein [Mangrovimonas spongiae]